MEVAEAEADAETSTPMDLGDTGPRPPSRIGQTGVELRPSVEAAQAVSGLLAAEAAQQAESQGPVPHQQGTVTVEDSADERVSMVFGPSAITFMELLRYSVLRSSTKSSTAEGRGFSPRAHSFLSATRMHHTGHRGSLFARNPLPFVGV